MFGFEIKETGWSDLLFTSLSTFVYTMVYVTLTFMIGVFTRSTGATIGVGMLIVLFESLVIMLLSKYSFTKYLLFANTNLSTYFNDQDPMIEGMTLTFSVSILAIYLFLFLVASFVTFKKRDIA
ncbi:ABC-2 family transporter protein [compost metagenome]